MFKKFVRHWNTGKLDVVRHAHACCVGLKCMSVNPSLWGVQDSYGGVTPAGLTHDSQTQYHWKVSCMLTYTAPLNTAVGTLIVQENYATITILCM